LIDRMLLVQASGDAVRADSLANMLLSEDSTLAHPYWVKGRIEEQKGNLQAALEHYKRFAILAPDDPDAPMVMRKLDELRQKLKDQ